MKTHYDRKAVGRAIRRARERRGLSERELAPKARLSAQAIRYIERGMVDPRTSTLVRLAMALDVAASDLLVSS
jgi:ribosome-binding protein aMBF1 (putative translation factor)